MNRKYHTDVKYGKSCKNWNVVKILKILSKLKISYDLKGKNWKYKWINCEN